MVLRVHHQEQASKGQGNDDKAKKITVRFNHEPVDADVGIGVAPATSDPKLISCVELVALRHCRKPPPTAIGIASGNTRDNEFYRAFVRFHRLFEREERQDQADPNFGAADVAKTDTNWLLGGYSASRQPFHDAVGWCFGERTR